MKPDIIVDEIVTAKDVLPVDCSIINIRRGVGHREQFIYCDLIGPDGRLIISADLDYITKRLHRAKFVSIKEYNKMIEGTVEKI